MEHSTTEDRQPAEPTARVLPPQEQYSVLKMLCYAFIVQIVCYAALAVGSLVSVPQEGAWTIVTNAQQGLMQLMGINLGAIAGAVAQQR